MTAGFPDTAHRRASYATIIVLTALVAAVYLPALSHGFVNWDDDRVLIENTAVTSPHGLALIWSTTELPAGFPNYPLVFTSYWLEHRLWGLNPLGYHAINVALHALNTFLVFLVVSSLGFSRRAALVAAGLFGLHPTQVESVAWVAERKNVLSASFYLSAFLAYQRAHDQTSRRGYWASLALFAAALFSKTATVVLPLSLILADRLRPGTSTRSSVTRVLPMFALAALASIATMSAENETVAVPLIERPLIAANAVWFYLRQLVAPTVLLPLYPRWEIYPDQALAWVPLVTLLGAIALVTLAASRQVQWGLGHFLCTLLPVLGLVSYGFNEYSFVADRNLYLACIGPFALCGITLDWLARRTRPRLTEALAGAVLAAMALLTLRQLPIWHSSEQLWKAAIAGNPDAFVAYRNLGFALIQDDRVDEAMPYLVKAVAMTPNSHEAHINLALALFRNERFAEAETHCRQAIRLSPDPKYMKNLALALQAQGKRGEAEVELRRGLALHPNDADLRWLLADALLEQGRLAESVPELTAALAANPESLPLRTKIGRVYLALGRGDEAVTALASVAEREPRSVEARYNLALALAKTGRTANATRELERSLEVQPDFRPAVELLAQLRSTPGL